MSDINPVNRLNGQLNNQRNGAVKKSGSVATFAKSADKARFGQAGGNKNAATLARALAQTGEKLDNPAKVRAFFGDPARSKAVAKQVEELVSSLNGDTSLDPIAYLPARNLSVVKGIMSILSKQDNFRQVQLRY